MKLKSKKGLLIFLIIVISFVIFWLKPKSIYETYHMNREKITKIEFFDLRNNPHMVTISARNKIIDFLKYIDEIKIGGSRPSIINSNEINVIRIYVNDKLVIKMCPTSTFMLEINGYEYFTYRNGLIV